MTRFLIALTVFVACVGTYGSTALADRVLSTGRDQRAAFPYPHSFMDRQAAAKNARSGVGVPLVLSVIRTLFMEYRVNTKLNAQSSQIAEHLNSGNHVVVYEVPLFTDSNGAVLMGDPIYTGAGQFSNAVIAKAHSMKLTRPDSAKAYRPAGSYFYHFTKGPNGAIVSERDYHLGTPKQPPAVILGTYRWPLADDLVRAAREEMARMAERARERERARAQGGNAGPSATGGNAGPSATGGNAGPSATAEDLLQPAAPSSPQGRVERPGPATGDGPDRSASSRGSGGGAGESGGSGGAQPDDREFIIESYPAMLSPQLLGLVRAARASR